MPVPGPRGPALWNLIRCVRRPKAFFQGGLARYGPTFQADLAGLGRFVFTGDPATLRDVFLGDPELLRTGEANAFAIETLGPSSVLTLDGEAHARARRALIPPLHGERLVAHAPLIAELTHRELDRWEPGRPRALEDACREIALQTILRAAFGLRDGPALEELADLIRQVMQPLAHPLAFFAPLLPSWAQGSTPRQVFRLQARIDDALLRLIAAKREADPGGPDVLAALLAMRHPDGAPLGDRELRDHLYTMLLAGHDTTAIALAWALGEILTHAPVRERIEAELEAVTAGAPLAHEHLKGLELLDATIKESLRLRPLVDFSVRLLAGPFSAGGVTYPAGTTLAPTTLLAHFDPASFPEPEAFRPERFLGQRPDPHTWIPFGGGRRRCLGMNFALLQMRVVLAVILSRVRFAPQAWEPRIARRGLFLAPRDRATFTPVTIAPATR